MKRDYQLPMKLTEYKRIKLTTMKTIAKITLTLMATALLSQATFANTWHSFRMQLSSGKEIFVISKLEKEVDEIIPFASAKLFAKNMNHSAIAGTTCTSAALVMDAEIMELVAEMHAEEEAVTENLGFDPQAVFEESLKEKAFELTPEILSTFIMEEKEVAEDGYYLTMTK
jgi:hypothetical protein